MVLDIKSRLSRINHVGIIRCLWCLKSVLISELAVIAPGVSYKLKLSYLIHPTEIMMDLARHRMDSMEVITVWILMTI